MRVTTVVGLLRRFRNLAIRDALRDRELRLERAWNFPRITVPRRLATRDARILRAATVHLRLKNFPRRRHSGPRAPSNNLCRPRRANRNSRTSPSDLRRAKTELTPRAQLLLENPPEIAQCFCLFCRRAKFSRGI